MTRSGPAWSTIQPTSSVGYGVKRTWRRTKSVGRIDSDVVWRQPSLMSCMHLHVSFFDAAGEARRIELLGMPTDDLRIELVIVKIRKDAGQRLHRLLQE